MKLKRLSYFAFVACVLGPTGTVDAAPNCPNGPNGKPSTAATSTQPQNSQYAILKKAIDKIKALTTLPGAARIGDCLQKRLDNGGLCVYPGGRGDPHGVTHVDGRSGWGADPIIIKEYTIIAAYLEVPPVGQTGNYLCELMATLVHEQTHADNCVKDDAGNPTKATNMKYAKEYELAATTASKLVLKECGLGTSSSYKWYCKWIEELCAIAAANPTAPPNYSCPRSGYVSRQSSTRPRFPDYLAVYSEPNKIYVSTGASDGSDAERWTDVYHVSAVYAYADSPTPGLDTLLVFGQNQSETNSIYQKMVFTDLGMPVSTGPVVTQGSGKITSIDHAPNSDVTYLLDIEQHRICTMLDQDGDGAPEVMGPFFAKSQQFSEMNDVIDISARADGLVVASDNVIRGDLGNLDATMHEFEDTSGNGKADVVTTDLLKDLLDVGPGFVTYPEPGVTEILILATVNESVELWKTDSAGIKISLLGTAAVNYADNTATLTVSPLMAGDFVVAEIIGGASSFPVEVDTAP